MDNEIAKSKLGQIVSKAESLHYHFKSHDPLLDAELTQLIAMLKVEHENHQSLTNALYALASKL